MGTHNNNQEKTPLVKEERMDVESPGEKHTVYSAAVDIVREAGNRITYTQAIQPEDADKKAKSEFSFKGLPENDGVSIVQKNQFNENAAFIKGTPNNIAYKNTLIQNNVPHDKAENASQANYVHLEHAHGNVVEQQGGEGALDHVLIGKNAQGNHIDQGKGDDLLEIKPSLTTCDNVSNGGATYLVKGKKQKTETRGDFDLIQFEGARSDYKFTFNDDGSITAFHKPTNTTPITFKNYDEVIFEGMMVSEPLSWLRKTQSELDAKEAVGNKKLPVDEKEREGMPQGGKPKSNVVSKQ